MNEVISSILARRWDPLGTVARGGYVDEYDSYIPALVNVAKAGDVVSVAEMLLNIERQQMLLEGEAHRAKTVARRLVDACLNYS